MGDLALVVFGAHIELPGGMLTHCDRDAPKEDVRPSIDRSDSWRLLDHRHQSDLGYQDKTHVSGQLLVAPRGQTAVALHLDLGRSSKDVSP